MEPATEAKSQRKPVVLVVEDEVLVRMAISDYLRDADLTVVEAANADEAVAVFSSRTAVDAVFTDVTMPGAMDGRVLAAWIARHHPGVPVLITSGVGDVAADIGGDTTKRFVAKPYRFADIEQRLRAMMDGV